MISLRSNIFKFYDNHDIMDYIPNNKIDRQKEQEELKKKIRLLDDLPQLKEERKKRKEKTALTEAEEEELSEEFMTEDEELELPEMDFDEEYRNSLMEKAETPDGLKELYEEAKRIDEKAMESISPNDKKRIIRILEIYKATGKNKTEQEILSRANGVKYDYQVYAIDMERNKLYDRINRRVDLMFEQGLIEEVKKLLEKYTEFPTAMQGIGYKEVAEYLRGDLTKDEMVEKLKQETRHYAKRQLTWFRKNKEIIWLNAENSMEDNIDIIMKGRNYFE